MAQAMLDNGMHRVGFDHLNLDETNSVPASVLYTAHSPYRWPFVRACLCTIYRTLALPLILCASLPLHYIPHTSLPLALCAS